MSEHRFAAGARYHPIDPDVVRRLRQRWAMRDGPALAVRRCAPTDLERLLGGRELWTLQDGKVCFSTDVAAGEFARAVAGHGGDVMEPYRCPRNGEHWHLRNVDKAAQTRQAFIDRVIAGNGGAG